jgi:hypothetical protein
MIKIKHRVNTLKELRQVGEDQGAEIDIRYHQDQLILHHDPFSHHKNKCLLFEEFLFNWHSSGPLILNVKTEGIEEKCITLMNKFNLSNWFFLDISMPYFVKFSNIALNKDIEGFSKKNLAVRFSEYETIEYALSFSNKAEWIWVDCFSKLPLNKETYDKIKKAKFKICLVSPELQGLKKEKIADFLTQIDKMEIEAVCTKYPELWK